MSGDGQGKDALAGISAASVRNRYVHRLLEPWISVHYSSTPTEEQKLDLSEEKTIKAHVPQLSRDESLTAFAQLVALRLNCKRAFISLVDSDSQYILTEATQSLIPGGDKFATHEETLWLGRTTLGRAHGICGTSCALMIGAEPDEGVFVVQDLRNHPSLNQNPLVLSRPDARFYAAIPLYGDEGYIVGVLAVFDDEPRLSLSLQEVSFARGTAGTISRHLTHCKGLAMRSRAERMIKGLSLFMEGGSSLRQWWIANKLSKFANKQSEAANLETHTQVNEEAVEEFGPEHFDGKQGIRPKLRQHSEEIATNSGRDTPSNVPNVSSQAERLYDEAQRASITSSDVHDIFSRASNIIREAISLDGVVFFDIADGRATSPLVEDKSCMGRSDQADGAPDDAAVCSILGFSVSAKSSLYGNTPSIHHKKMRQADMNTLMSRYPQGKIFNYSADASLSASSDSNMDEREPNLNDANNFRYLRSIAPNARSVAFFPLWDYLKSRWLSGCIAWTSNPFRFLAMSEDLMYLRACGATIMTSVSQLDAMNAEKSKSLLLSAVSHEMRSPLHGILASIEFFKDTKLDSMGEVLLHTIETSGQTLLDTINNILEYASLSSESSTDNTTALNSIREDNSASTTVARQNQISDFAAILEEVASSVVLGSMHANQAHTSTPPQSSDPVTFVLDLDWQHVWQIVGINPMSLKRIAMNLIRNASKFTDSGHIVVSLRQTTSTVGQAPQSASLMLEVKDTGCGISQEYLNHHLFDAFSKDNLDGQGTGLGLHLTQRLVLEFGGTIDVSSTVDTGTSVRVAIPSDRTISTSRILKENYHRITVGLVGFGAVKTAAEHALHSSIRSILRDAVGVQVDEVDDLHSTSADILLMDSDYFKINIEPVLDKDAEKPLIAPLIVLCPDLLYARKVFKRFPHTHFLLSPYGANLISHVIAKCYPSAFEGVSDERLSSQVLHDESSFEGSQTSKQLEHESSNSGVDPQARESSRSNIETTPLSPTTGSSQLQGLEHIRILLVEDNDINLKLLVAFARKHKMQYSTATNGQEAFEIFRSNAFDDTADKFKAVITDIDMPVMNGLDFCRRVRALEKQTGRAQETLLLITLTGVSSDPVKHEAKAAGVNVFLSKPARFKEIAIILKDRIKNEA